jgi:dipeptidyl aminopeptidase/acylaminoacyl peptidase
MQKSWVAGGLTALMVGAAWLGTPQQSWADNHGEDAVETIELIDLMNYESVSNPQISPDGTKILYTRGRVDAVKDRRTAAIWIMNADGTNKRQLMDGGRALWSPDGKRILFSKADDNDKAQLFVRSEDGLITQLTHSEHAPRSMAWSPDGQSIAFVARVPVQEDWTISLPPRPKGAEWSPDPVIVDTLHYRQDRVGITNDGFDHIFVVPATGGTPRQITEGDWNVGVRGIGVIAGSPTLAWSPDSQTIAFDGPGGAHDPRQWWTSHINLVNVKTKQLSQLTPDGGSWRTPVFSPNGKTIALVGYADHDKLTPLADLYIMDADGSDLRALTSDLPDSPQIPYFTPDGKTVLFAAEAEGARNIQAVTLGGRMTAVTSGPQVVNLSSISDSGRIAITQSQSDRPGTIATLSSASRGASITPLTDVNGDIFDGVTFGKVEEVWYDATSADGQTARIQGWFVYPPDYDASKQYPLILSIHGGPQAMYNTGFNLRFQEMAAEGYVVLYTNPRGSTGYGESFVNIINNQYPGQYDYADLMAGVDLAIDRGIADPDRLFVMGCSGGGVLTTHVIGQTDRFAAAAALCPVTNWISMSGTTDVSAWLYSFFDKPFWEDPDPWMKNSTIMSVGNVTTPTLLMTGIKDIRTPLQEAENYYAALKMRGVPAKLIPMPNEYHGTSATPSNFLRTQLYLRKWFEEHDPTLEQDEED